MDDENYLYFVARKNNMIKTAGEIVSPKEVENILYEIDDIIEAGVVGAPDEILGQAITAFVALKEDSKLTKEEIILYCSKNLEKFMVPRYIEIRKQLPRTSTGKLDLKNLASNLNI
jgi:acyl-coenzyme A synthetase/AMP-(fatty) acid ligase